VASLVTVRVFHSMREALVAKSCLEAYGLVVFLQDWSMLTNCWFHMVALHGIRLQVPETEAALAAALLDCAIAPEAAQGPLRLRSLAFALAALLVVGLPHEVSRHPPASASG
jgi:hypothetical protein